MITSFVATSHSISTRVLKIVLATTFASLASVAGASVAHEATPADKSAKLLVQRLAAAEGRTLKWEVARDFSIGDAGALNRAAGLIDAKDMSDAVTRVISLLNKNRPEDAPLNWCVKGKAAVLVTTVRGACAKR